MLNPNMLPNALGGQTVTGEMSMAEVGELQKAMEAGYGSDVSQLTGAGALRIQSLEKTMLSTIQENKHFALFNELAKTNATATVDEWTEQSGIGGFLGGSTNTETGTIQNAQGQYNRRVGMVKFLMTRREISFVATLQNAIVEAEAVEAQNGALQLLTDAEFLCFEGDSTVVPTEFDGIATQIETLNGGDHIIDAGGLPLNSIDMVDRAAAQIAGFGNFGTPTHIFTSQLVQSDFNTNLDPAFRVALTGQSNEVALGAPVKGISTSWGDIKNVPDVFIRDERQMMPFEVDYPAVAAANASMAPASVTTAHGSDAASKFAAGQAGNYYYAVASVSAAGQSPVVVTGQVAVSAGDKVTLTITKSAVSSETGYAIYRGRLNGTNDLTDLRLVCRIPRNFGGNTTTYVDYNRKIPGTTKAYIMNMAPGAQAITWRQMLPMTKFPLYPTASAVVPWAQLLFGYLRIGKRKHHVVIENVVASGQSWKPFG